MSNWFQALPQEIAGFLDVPPADSALGVLVSEKGHREIRQDWDQFSLFERWPSGSRQVKGMTFAHPGILAETHDTLSRLREDGPVPVWVVFECFDKAGAEYWRQIVGNNAIRKGQFVMAKMLPGNRLLQPGNPQRQQTVNPHAEYVPDGVAIYPDQETAAGFFNQIAEHASITRASHALGPDEQEKAIALSGFDLSGFKRIGAALGDPLFMGPNAHSNIRERLRALFRRSPLSHLSTNGLAGNKTAGDIRTIYNALIKDFATDVPQHFNVLKDAVLEVADDYPKINPHQDLSTKTWHNNVSGVLSGSSNTTNNRLTAKWAVILSVIAAHNSDLTPVHENISAERLFFWVVYGSPEHLIKAAAARGVALTTGVLPAYPKLAFDDLSLRKPIVHLLDESPPHLSDDWENNFSLRIK